MESKFAFDRSFQIGILNLMTRNYEFLVSCVDLVKPSYFEDTVLIWFYTTIRGYFLDYRKTPNYDIIWNELLKATKSGKIREFETQAYTETFVALQDSLGSDEYIIDEVVSFCRRQELKKVILEYAPQIETADDEIFDKIENKIKNACNIGTHALNLGVQYLHDFPERLRKREEGEDRLIIPTGITQLDNYIGGGLKSGQLGILVGATNAGKSIFLPHVAKRAVVGGFTVAYYTLELSETDVADRFDASFSGTDIGLLEENSSLIQERLGDLGDKYGNSLFIKFYPTKRASVDTIRAHLHQLSSIGVSPHLVVVDYLDLLKPLTSYNDQYADLGGITADLRGLAGDFMIPVWTVTQANRGGQNVEILDVEHMGDSIQKQFIADIVVGLCCTREEYQHHKARLFLSKNRNGPKNIQIPIVTAYNRMCFYDPIASSQLNPITVFNTKKGNSNGKF